MEDATQPDGRLSDLLSASFARVVGRPLIASGSGSASLYGAPFAVLAHGTGPDPTFIYANRAAQRLFGYDWDEFVETRSRLSAPPMDRAEREVLLGAVTQRGFVEDYSGVRISSSGRLFRIERAVVWQLWDDDGVLRGQGAAFDSWSDVHPSGS